MYTIAVSNEKGGTGKSTSALNVAAAIAERGHRTLLLDLDPSYGLTRMLGVDANNFEVTVREVLLPDHDATIREATQEAKNVSPNLFFVPGHPDLAVIETMRRGDIQWPYIVKTELERVEDAYDFAVIDCPPGVAFFPVNAYVAADLLLIPIQTEYIALTSLPKIGEVLAAIPKDDQPGTYLILPTMYDKRTKHAQEFMTMLLEQHPNNLSKHIVPRTVGISDSTIEGKPFIHYDRDHVASQAYRGVAEEIISECQNNEPA